ncbi:hypothetical protein D3C86_1909450 [compost metagenome]
MFAGLFEGVGFADDPVAEHGDLVGADDQMSVMAVRQCAGFLLGEAFYQINGSLARTMTFVDVR